MLLIFAFCLIFRRTGLCYFRRRGFNVALSERCYSSLSDFSPLVGIMLLLRYARTAAIVHPKRRAVSLFWTQVSYPRIIVRRALRLL